MSSEHYYSKNPQSENITETKQVILNNHSFTFTMGAGVFSKKGIDFGTRLLIEHFQAPDHDGDILDLGCGYGPIGIALAHQFPSREVLMTDINERAVSLAKQNAEQNDVTNVTVMQSEGFLKIEEHIFATIVTNPPIRAGKTVVYNLFRDSKSHLVDGGELWIVIQKKQGAPSAIKYLTSIFNEVETMTRKKGYYVIRTKK